MKQLDYTALQKPLTRQDIHQYRSQIRGASGASPYIPLIVTGIIAIAVLAPSIVSTIASGNGDITDLIGTAMMTAIIIGMGVVAYAFMASTLNRRVRLIQFAQQNDLKYVYDAGTPSYSGMIFDEGHSRSIIDALIFKDGSEIGNYAYTTGSGKNRTTHHWSYARIKLVRRLPHMVLDAKKNNLFGKFSNLPDMFSKDQRLSLEGNFNDHFTLYAPKEYERDALYVFTPDVMAAVIDSGQYYDMEVVDDNLILYTQTPIQLTSPKSIQQILSVMGSIGTELLDQSDYYADERVADRTQNIIATPGKRLKSGVSFAIIIVFIFILYQVISMFLSFF